MFVKPGNKDHANVVIHPPVLFALTCGWAGLLHLLAPLTFTDVVGWGGATRTLPGQVLTVGGLAIAVVAAWQFLRAGTNIPTGTTTTALVTHGVYGRSRNPIYVGALSFLLGLALWLDTLWLALAVPMVFGALTELVIKREEAYLETKFGDAYRRYCKTVRRWV